MILTIDRIELARQLAAGRRTLDIGGQKMANCDPNSPFAKNYARIEQAAREYRIVDYQEQPSVDYVVDFNQPASLPRIREIIDEFKPETIICMETLEHINYHFELMNEMAGAVERLGSRVFITIPHNGNWVFNALGWNHDHSIAFFRDVAWRFVTRSQLGAHQVSIGPCMQKYLWYWWIAYALSFFQPFSWGFVVAPRQVQPGDEWKTTWDQMRAYTASHFPD